MIVLVGLAIGSVGVWVLIKNRPHEGPVIDQFAIDKGQEIVVRAEEGGDRNFIELRENGEVKWQALIPPYAGDKNRRGIAVGDHAVSIRVVRGGKAEIFAVARANGSKLGSTHLAQEHGPIVREGTGPITLSDGVRSYEIVSGSDWNQLIAMDLKLGTRLWKQELGPGAVTGGSVEGGLVKVEHAKISRWFNVFTGQEDKSFETTGRRPGDPVPP